MNGYYSSLEQQNQNAERLDASDFGRGGANVGFDGTLGDGTSVGFGSALGSGRGVAVAERPADRAFFAPTDERAALKNDANSAAVDTIVVVCGDSGSRTAMRRCLEVENVDVVEATSVETLTTLPISDASGFLIDSATLDVQPETLCRQIVDKYPDAPIIFMDEPTGDAERRKRLGKIVHSYIVKPCERQALLQAARQALKLSRYARENRSLRQTIGTPTLQTTMAGVSAPIQTLRKQIEAFGRLDATILISGERGVGKSVVAQQIHQAGPRARFPFVVVSCNALPPETLEADLFGVAKGAIPGVSGERPGRLELAHRGTIFLDHVEDLSPALQKRIFQFIQEKTTRRVGSSEPRRVDARIIASTSCDLAIACVQGRFRDELYFRLNALTLTVPPLRDRAEDVPALSREIMSRIARANDRNLSILSTAALNKLRQYSWPYNVRELESVLQKAMETAPDVVISENDVSFDTMIKDSRSPDGAMGLAGLTMAEIERRAIIETINACGGNRAQSARKLGVSEKTIYNKIKQFKLRGIV